MKKIIRYSLQIALIYWVSGIVWIYLSDSFIRILPFAQSLENLTFFQTLKGFAYVSVTAVLLYWLEYVFMNRLDKSKNQYRKLFAENPLPMWIYDIKSYKFMAVNDAAIAHYGYSKKEFLQMTVFDIRPQTEISRLKNFLENDNGINQYQNLGTWQHCKKNGEIIEVSINSHTTDFNNRVARLVVAMDVTENKRMQEQREKMFQDFVDFAFMTSHKLRRPLANMLGLMNIFNYENPADTLNFVILEKLRASSQELDEIIHQMNDILENKAYYKNLDEKK